MTLSQQHEPDDGDRICTVVAVAVGSGFSGLSLLIGTSPREAFLFAVGVTVALVPEGRGVFGRLTVRENLELGAFQRRDRAIVSDVERVFALFPRLRERAGQAGGHFHGALIGFGGFLLIRYLRSRR